MPSKDQVLAHLTDLIFDMCDFSRNYKNAAEQGRYNEGLAHANGLLASAAAVIEALVIRPDQAHRRIAATIIGQGARGDYVAQVESILSVLQRLQMDVSRGLVQSVEDTATAMAFYSFLDHAEQYVKFGRHQESGAIAAVVFEDAMRRAGAAHEIVTQNNGMEDLIAALEREGVLNKHQGRRARACSTLRTSATHARWDEFDLNGVRDCIRFTREFIAAEFGGS